MSPHVGHGRRLGALQMFVSNHVRSFATALQRLKAPLVLRMLVLVESLHEQLRSPLVSFFKVHDLSRDAVLASRMLRCGWRNCIFKLEDDSFIQPSCLDELGDLVLTCLIRVTLPDLIQTNQLLRSLDDGLDIHVTVRQPVY